MARKARCQEKEAAANSVCCQETMHRQEVKPPINRIPAPSEPSPSVTPILLKVPHPSEIAPPYWGTTVQIYELVEDVTFRLQFTNWKRAVQEKKK